MLRSRLILHSKQNMSVLSISEKICGFESATTTTKTYKQLAQSIERPIDRFITNSKTNSDENTKIGMFWFDWRKKRREKQWFVKASLRRTSEKNRKGEKKAVIFFLRFGIEKVRWSRSMSIAKDGIFCVCLGGEGLFSVATLPRDSLSGEKERFMREGKLSYVPIWSVQWWLETVQNRACGSKDFASSDRPSTFNQIRTIRNQVDELIVIPFRWQHSPEPTVPTFTVTCTTFDK